LVNYVFILEHGKVVLRWDLLLSPTAYWEDKLSADVFSTLQGREAVITCCATITDLAMAVWEEELSADIFSTLQGREAVIMGRAAVTYSTKATCLAQIVSKEQVKVSFPLAFAKVSWILFLSWWARLPAPHLAVTVAVILIPVLAVSTLAWTGLVCNFEVINGSFCTVESFCVCIEFIILFLSQA